MPSFTTFLLLVYILVGQVLVQDVPCVDDNKHCPDWSKSGECEKNPDYMLVNCRKSCKVCTDDKNLTHCEIESLSFALDTSQSMDSNKDIWRPVMIKLVEEMARRQVNFDKHCLFDYMNTNKRVIMTTESEKDFINYIRGYQLPGWGDRATTFAALKHALGAAKKSAFICVWTDELGEDTKDAALKAEILDVASATNSIIFFMVIPDSLWYNHKVKLEQFNARFSDLGHVMDIKNDPDVITKMIQIMKKSGICNQKYVLAQNRFWVQNK